MLVSLFCDASWYHKEMRGGWGCWIKSNRGQTQGGAAFKTKLRSSNEAELCAAVNALILGLNHGIILPDDVVLVQSDCMRVIHLLQGTHFAKSPVEGTAMKKLKNLQSKQRLTIRARWVKGHSSGSPRNWVNNLCDKLSRQG